jgi:hypothetical protein
MAWMIPEGIVEGVEALGEIYGEYKAAKDTYGKVQEVAEDLQQGYQKLNPAEKRRLDQPGGPFGSPRKYHKGSGGDPLQPQQGSKRPSDSSSSGDSSRQKFNPPKMPGNDEMKSHEAMADDEEKRKSLVPCQFLLRYPGMSRRVFHPYPDQALVRTRFVLRGTIPLYNFMSGPAGHGQVDASVTPTFATAHVGPPTVAGKFFYFNMNSWRFPVAHLPEGSVLNSTTGINDEPRGYTQWKSIYQYYRLEGQKIRFNMWINNVKDDTLDDDRYLTILTRRYISASHEPTQIENEDSLDAWNDLTGIDAGDLTHAYEEKSAQLEHMNVISRRSDRMKPKMHSWTMKYGRKEFAQASRKLGEAGFDNAADSALEGMFTRFFALTAHDLGHREPPHYIVQETGGRIRGFVPSGTLADSNANIHFHITATALVRLHDPIQQNN